MIITAFIWYFGLNFGILLLAGFLWFTWWVFKVTQWPPTNLDDWHEQNKPVGEAKPSAPPPAPPAPPLPPGEELRRKALELEKAIWHKKLQLLSQLEEMNNIDREEKPPKLGPGVIVNLQPEATDDQN